MVFQATHVLNIPVEFGSKNSRAQILQFFELQNV